MGMTTACSDDDDKDKNTTTEEDVSQGGENNDGQASITVMTAEDAQREFDRVGRQLINKIDANKFDPIFTLSQFCSEKFLGDDEVAVNPDHNYPYDTNKSRNLRNIMRHMETTAQGDFAGVTSIRRITETYRFSDYCGIFTWNESAQDWDEQKSTSELTYKFDHNGTPCVVTVKTSGTEYTWTVKNDRGTATDYVVIPSQLTATVTEGNTVLASFVLNVPECSQSGKNYRLNGELKVSDYTIAGEVTDNNATAKATCYIALDTEKLIEGTIEFNGSSLADDDAFIREEFGHENVKGGKVTCSVLGSIVLNMQADNTSGLSRELDFDGYYSYSEYKDYWMTTPSIYKWSDKATAERNARAAANAANRDVTSYITFTQGTYKADVEWEAYLFDQYFYSWGPDTNGNYSKYESGEWEIRPVIVFDNNSRYSFENYFNETRFSSLISLFESLAEDFEDLDK